MERKSISTTAFPILPSKPLIHSCIVRLHGHELLLSIFFLSSPFLLQRPLAAEITSFNYLDFSNFSEISIKGDASVDGGGAILLNIKNRDDSLGLAYWRHPIHLWSAATRELANFSTTFTFGVSYYGGLYLSGGIMFFLMGYPTIPYLSLTTASGNTQFVAVEFHSNLNISTLDGLTSHVGIDISSLASAAIVMMPGNPFRPGPQGTARIAYNSISKNLTVFLEYDGTFYQLSHAVDLRDELPEMVYVGFSLSTYQSHDPKNITSWSFQSNLDAPEEPPPPPRSPSPAPRGPIQSWANNNKRSTKKKTVILVVATAVPLLIVLIIGILCFFLRKFKSTKCKDRVVGEINNKGTTPHNREECRAEAPPLNREHVHRNDSLKEEFEDWGPGRIPFKELVDATDNFHHSRRLGKGAFGGVYHGFLKDLNREVAIKRIAEYSEHGEKEFAAEVKTISRSRHRNLVQLIGYCREGCELLLVYEFMPNGSLDLHLFDNGDKVLSWPRRRNIALGLASALQYLHEELDKCIVHRDIKPSNILLDREFNAKLGDFGLARTADHGSALQSTMMAGTMGYMAPEYFITCKANKEADVYSYGIVALELVSGRRAVDPREKGREALIHWIWELYGEGTIMDAVDKKLARTFNEQEAKRLIRVGLWCAHPEARSRPSFRQVISALNFEIVVPDLNINPSSIVQQSYSLVSGMSSSTKSSDDYNDGKSNNEQVTTSTSVCRG